MNAQAERWLGLAANSLWRCGQFTATSLHDQKWGEASDDKKK